MAAFTLIFDGDEIFTLEIPAAGVIPPEEPAEPHLEGTVVGVGGLKVVCQNLRTRRKVTLQPEGTTWDCVAAGLEVEPGDKVKVTISGVVE